MADSVANAIDELPGLAYGWANGTCTTPLRYAQNTCQYDAVNCSSCGSASHDCGQLIAGINYDIRQRLKASHPSDYRDILNPIMFSSIPMNGFSYISSDILDDYLALDDNDGNLANGTPHRTEICGGFNAHGITDANCPPPTPTNPCGSFCSTPTTFTWTGSYWSGDLGTGAVCRETISVSSHAAR
jgi:hypothetical protein